MTPFVYLIPVWDTITDAWYKVSGSKGSFWAAIIIVFIIGFVLGLIQGAIHNHSPVLSPITQLIISIINFLLVLGLMYMGIKRAFGEPISCSMVFYAFNGSIAFKAILIYILQMLILLIPSIIMGISIFVYTFGGSFSTVLSIILFVVALLSIIYLGLSMITSMAFLLDKGFGPWECISCSFKVTRHNIFRLVGISILEFIIIVISMIPFGIGLIWTLPLAYIIYGTIYKRLSANLTTTVVSPTPAI